MDIQRVFITFKPFTIYCLLTFFTFRIHDIIFRTGVSNKQDPDGLNYIIMKTNRHSPFIVLQIFNDQIKFGKSVQRASLVSYSKEQLPTGKVLFAAAWGTTNNRSLSQALPDYLHGRTVYKSEVKAFDAGYENYFFICGRNETSLWLYDIGAPVFDVDTKEVVGLIHGPMKQNGKVPFLTLVAFIAPMRREINSLIKHFQGD